MLQFKDCKLGEQVSIENLANGIIIAKGKINDMPMYLLVSANKTNPWGWRMNPGIPFLWEKEITESLIPPKDIRETFKWGYWFKDEDNITKIESKFASIGKIPIGSKILIKDNNKYVEGTIIARSTSGYTTIGFKDYGKTYKWKTANNPDSIGYIRYGSNDKKELWKNIEELIKEFPYAYNYDNDSKEEYYVFLEYPIEHKEEEKNKNNSNCEINTNLVFQDLSIVNSTQKLENNLSKESVNKQVLYRVATTQIVKNLKLSIVSYLQKNKNNNIEAIAELLNTDAGQGILSIIAGYILTYSFNNKSLNKLAEEFRISGFSDIGNSVIKNFIEYLLPVIEDALISNTKERVVLPEEKLEDEMPFEEVIKNIGELK